MKREFIQGENGYSIPCAGALSGKEKRVVLFCHGLGSSKESPTVLTVSPVLREQGIGTFAFDFPGHGESPADGERFRVENCVNDLAAVEAHVRSLCPGAEIGYFASSFGAYINLIYLSTRAPAGRSSFLRCAAVDMAGIMKRNTTREHEAQLEVQGYVVLDGDYARPLKITRGFLEDLSAYDVFRLYRPGTARLEMIHGTADETAPLADARRFANHAGAELLEVEGADHRFLIPGGMERVADAALRFFTPYAADTRWEVRRLARIELPEALELAWEVFSEYVAPGYSEEGIRTFQSVLQNPETTENFSFYGAFDGENLAGMAATRNGGEHISLFFVRTPYQGKRAGRALFGAMRKDSPSGCLTVNSSPYALAVYRCLGFSGDGEERLQDGIRYIPLRYGKGKEE